MSAAFRENFNLPFFITWSMNIFLCARDFVYFASFVYIAAFNNFKVHIPSNLGVHQDFHQLT